MAASTWACSTCRPRASRDRERAMPGQAQSWMTCFQPSLLCSTTTCTRWPNVRSPTSKLRSHVRQSRFCHHGETSMAADRGGRIGVLGLNLEPRPRLFLALYRPQARPPTRPEPPWDEVWLGLETACLESKEQRASRPRVSSAGSGKAGIADRCLATLRRQPRPRTLHEAIRHTRPEMRRRT